MAPLISFTSIVDTDVGLVNLIRKEYLDTRVFEKSFFDMDFYKIIKSLYHRKERNLLYLFAKDKSNTELLDSYYNEFIERCMPEILQMSITTEVLSLVEYFNNSQEIKATILCYSEDQLKIIEDEPVLKKNRKVLFSNLSERDKESFSQYFFKEVEEIENFKKCRNKTFYISSFRANFTEENDVKELDFLKDIYRNINAINIFDMYNKDIFGG